MLWRESNFFWLLPVVLLLAVGLLIAVRGRARAFGSFADQALVRRLALGVSTGRRDARVVLRVTVLALLVFALAGPKYGFHWEEVRREGIDLIVAIDTSRSMLATDVKPNRLERAKLAVLDLIPRLRGDRIGLVAYAGTAFLESPLTLDYAAFSRSLRALQVGIIPRGGTSLSRAIETSLEGFEARQGKYEALILITDGEDHEGDALEAAETAAERGVKIYTVGIGTPEGELLPLPGGAAAGYVKDRKGQVVKSRLNESLLRDIALNTGGAYVRGLGPQLGLDEVFDQHIAKMERREVDSGLERRFEERFQILLLLAILLLIVEIALGETKGVRRAAPRRWLARLASRVGWRTALLPLLALLAGADAARGGWLDGELDPVNRGVESFESGDYAAAVDTFGGALVESPASPLLQFDLAAALYKHGRYEDAIVTLEKVAAEGGDEWSTRANYNLGNAYFRAGAEVEGENPQQTLEKWAQAMLAYRRAMATDPSDEDAKFNHELTERRTRELKERLERERQEQEEQEEQDQQDQEQEQQEQEQQEQEQQEQEQDDEQEQQEQGQDDEQEQQEPGGEEEEGSEPEPQDQQEGGEDAPQPEEQQQEQQEPGGEEPESDERQPQPGEAEPQPDEASDSESQASGGSSTDAAEQEAAENAAHAVLDTARTEELGPEDVGRRIGVRGVGDALEDW